MSATSAGSSRVVVGDHAILLAAQLHGGVDAVIRHAAAERALHAVADLRVGGIRRLVEQRLGGEDLAVLAEAARRHLLVDPRLLNRMELAVLRESFERGDLGALHLRHRPDARAHRLALDQHGARAALAEAAAEARPAQIEVVPEHIEQRRGRLDVDACASCR